VITANPGCMLQVEMGYKSRGIHGRARHVVDILDEAYSLK
jgi:Fe-S oxidoreductase